ncbi:hypothetical protein BCR33DRAFT_713280 [Rhizoclosmatium globosum]|uniref:PIH1 N-terminal domain-containing protein n=1 Tax=Rhizoclosmatium globosum TaxID=329046 RepID=A0A1Y2CTZ0_9FUNG|nr:hypothetical protein BCR33DRAFT_713280 [Rhizoclosmatium globosum]|eukprot:ORY50491.1 hypothetical protein BCR33DRAFT_713280 [Rhizoclosmatium globosum]
MNPLEQFTPEELMQKGSKIWKQLDELVATDPQAYREYIKSVTESANTPEESHIKPGFRLETKELNSDISKVYHINIAVTDKLEAPPAHDPLNIPVCLSEIRTGEDKKSKVVDALINPAVLDKCNKDSFFKSDIINLVIDCIDETHGVKLSKRTNKIYENEYKGPFGWENGKPLSDADIAKKNDVKVVAESAEESGLSSLKLPSQPAVNLKSHSASSQPPIIQVVNSEASWSQKESATHQIFYCILPNAKSQSEIDINLKEGIIKVSTSKHNISIPALNLKSIHDCEAKFIKSSETLKIKIPK